MCVVCVSCQDCRNENNHNLSLGIFEVVGIFAEQRVLDDPSI